MVSRAAREAAHDFAERMHARFGERLVWVRLYGSHARGDAHEDSDVDVAALVRDLTWRENKDAIDLGFDVSLARRLHVSPMVMSSAEFERLLALESCFAQSIVDEGIAA